MVFLQNTVIVAESCKHTQASHLALQLMFNSVDLRLKLG